MPDRRDRIGRQEERRTPRDLHLCLKEHRIDKTETAPGTDDLSDRHALPHGGGPEEIQRPAHRPQPRRAADRSDPLGRRRQCPTDGRPTYLRAPRPERAGHLLGTQHGGPGGRIGGVNSTEVGNIHH